jgi:serine/threonine-protein kinase ULK/ATG1
MSPRSPFQRVDLSLVCRLYMAPEILRHEKYDAKADLWSVGTVLYEMAVGKPPFRAQNYMELLKKIETSKGVKFPDEDPQRAGTDDLVVPIDVKQLIRGLLKRNPVERSSFEDFFGSTALARSKFLKVLNTSPDDAVDETSNNNGSPPVPPSHRIIQPEVLDPNAMIPPSKFNFRKRDSVAGVHDETSGTPPATETTLPSRLSPRRPTKPLSTEGSIIPGETEEDGLLRREYVLVGDTRAVEFNRAVDGKTFRLSIYMDYV